MKRLTLLLLTMLFPFFSACGTTPRSNPLQNDGRETVDALQDSFVAAGNDFAFRFLKKIDGCEKKDWFVSPVSLQFLLGLVLDGAEGETAAEIARTLGFGDGDAETFDRYSRWMLDTLPRIDQAVRLKLANAIFFNKQMTINKDYKKRVEQFYDAEVQSLDFSQKQSSLRAINGWCSKQTEGMIPGVLDDVDPGMFAYLLNALYFKGAWSYPFDKRWTQDRTFHLEDGQEKKVDMMEKERKFSYAETELFQRIRLPYGDGPFSMIVLLPKKGHTVAEVIESLDGADWENLRKNWDFPKVNLWLPRFETKYHIKLNDILCEMGMPRSFAPAAEFKPMSPDALWLSFVQQDAIIKVNEEGSEAAAVTSAGMLGATAVPNPPKVIDFHCDHPFLYFITEARTGAILFAGKFTGN